MLYVSLFLLLFVAPAHAYEPQFSIPDPAVDQNFKNLAAEAKTITTDLDTAEATLATAAQLASTQTFTGANTFTGSVSGVSNSSSTLITTTQGSITNTSFSQCITGTTVTITTNGGRVLVAFSGSLNASAIIAISLTAQIDGVLWSGQNAATIISTGGVWYNENAVFSVLTDNLSAGAHSFCLAVKVASGTGQVLGNADGVTSQFWVQELR